MKARPTSVSSRLIRAALLATILHACASSSSAPPVSSVANTEPNGLAIARRELERTMVLTYEDPLRTRPRLEAFWRTFELYGVLCADGELSACLVATRHPPMGREDEIVVRIARNCRAGHAFSCRWVHEHSSENSELTRLSNAELREGCLAGLDMECLALSDSDALRDVRFAHDTDCIYNHHACEDAADSYLEQEPRDPDRARYLLEHSCQLGHLFGCLRLAIGYENGELAAPVPGRTAVVKAFLCKDWQYCGQLRMPDL